MLEKLWDRLSSMFQEDSEPGAWSATRFAFVFAVLISNVIVFFSIAYIAISDGKIPDIPEGVIWIYALANGIAFGGKVIQKFKETK